MRPSKDNYYMKIAFDVGERSTCARRKVGSVIVNGDEIISTGYNGSVRGQPHCIDIGCLRDKLSIESGTRHEICRAVHSEQNAIIQAGSEACNGGTIYITLVPCIICAKLIVNAGIVRVVYSEEYTNSDGLIFLKECGIEVVKI